MTSTINSETLFLSPSYRTTDKNVATGTINLDDSKSSSSDWILYVLAIVVILYISISLISGSINKSKSIAKEKAVTESSNIAYKTTYDEDITNIGVDFPPVPQHSGCHEGMWFEFHTDQYLTIMDKYGNLHDIGPDHPENQSDNEANTEWYVKLRKGTYSPNPRLTTFNYRWK